MLGNELAEAPSFVQLARQNEASIGANENYWKSTFKEALKESWKGWLVSYLQGADLRGGFVVLEPHKHR